MVILCALFAIGRLSWLSSSRSIIAEMFPGEEAVAFSSLNFTYALGCSMMCYAISAGLTSSSILGLLVILPAICIVPSYFIVHGRNPSRDE